MNHESLIISLWLECELSLYIPIYPIIITMTITGH